MARGPAAIRRLAIGLALLVVAVAWAPSSAQALQMPSRVHSYFSERIDTGNNHTCAIAPDGTVHCWGLANSGQLGYGNTNNIGDNESPSSAGAVDLGGHTAVAVSTGGNNTCAILDNGTVRCWGLNSSAQLGIGFAVGNVGDNETPGSVSTVNLGASRTAAAISVGTNHTCAILDNGTLRCWGLNSNGQLGYGNKNDIGDNENPGSVGPVDLGAGRTAIAVSVGSFHTCAILDNGTVRCWGSASSGQLGYGNKNDIGDNELPSSVGTVSLGLGRSAVAIAAGHNHTCALLDNGTVRCWGLNTNGQLGYGNTNNIGDDELPSAAGPVDLGSGRNAIALTGGAQHTCAILDNGTTRCWGLGTSGQIGLGGSNSIVGDNETPAAVNTVDVGASRNAIAIAAGETHTCARLDNGTIRCWGLASSGQLGYGNTANIGDNEMPSTAGPVNLGTIHGTIAVAAGGIYACGIMEEGTVRCWGSSVQGALGYPGVNNVGADETPGSVDPVDLGGHSAVQIVAGATFTCVLHDNGTVRCWGFGGSGQLGYGSPLSVGDNETPGSVGPIDLGGRSAVQIAAGASHACAILDNGTVRCWGSASKGQLGYGNTNNIGDNEVPGSVGPVDLGLGRTAVAIDAGDDFTCALLDNGTVRCWGHNTSGQLGYGNTTDIGDNETPAAAGPVSTVSNRSAVGVTAGAFHTCAQLDNGTLMCWGGNGGKLGYATTADVGDNELPSTAGTVDVGSGRNVATVFAGEIHTCAVLNNRTVRCWGFNGNGQLGYGNTTTIGDDEVPGTAGTVDLGPERTAVSVTLGDKFTCAILDNGSMRCWGANHSGQLGYGNEVQIGDDELPSSVGPVDFVDDPPVAVNDTATLNEDAAATAIAVLKNDLDEDGGPAKTIESKTNGAHGTVAITGGGTGLTYLPVANYCGPDSFTYELNGGSKATVSVTVTCIDDLPVAVNDSKTLTEDDPATAIGVLANDTDIDAGPKLVEAKTNGANGTVAITGGGSDLTYLPAANYCGLDSFTYTLNGGSKATVSISVTCVDDPPVAVNDSESLTEDDPATAIDVLGNDTDIDAGPAKKVEAKTNGAHGTATIIGGGVALTYQPDPNYCGSDSFTYTLNGGSVGTVSVSIACVDDPPVAVNDSPTVLEDASATSLDVLANDTDIDAGPKAIGAKTNGIHGGVSITGGGSALSYLPDPNYCGPDSFTYELNGGSKAIVSVSVTCVDDAPVAVNDSKTLAEDDPATAIDVLGNDTDIDGGPKLVGAKANGTHGTVAITGGGTGLTYVPAANYCGPDSFTYELNGGSSTTVSVTVTCVDDPPAAAGDSATVAEDASATAVDVLANDTDIDAGPKTVASKTNGSHGAVAITGGGTGLTYTPDANYCGPDSFTYDLNGGSTATVSVTVTCVDDPPTAAGDSAAMGEDASATAIDVLANDTDIDSGPKAVASKTDGAHGSVVITGGGTGLTYTPAANYCGADSFTYTLNGGSIGTVSIAVTCVDDPPVAASDSDTVLEDSSANAIDVLANDTDPDAGPRAITGRTNGSHGAVAVIGGGAGLTYAPDHDYCGPDSFTYTLNGGSIGNVSISVTCVDEPPPPGGEGGSNNGQTTIIGGNDGPSGPVVNVTPGVGVVSGRRHPRIAIKGAYAFFTLTCKFKDKDCIGTVTITATIPSIALGPTQDDVPLVKGKFRIGAGRSVLVRAKLTKAGLKVLEAKKTLRGIASRMTIVDADNSERGEIEVNLVRRPKASLLPGTTK